MLEEAYLKTITYFDLFDFPLTNVEFFRYLWQQKVSWDDHLENLNELVERGLLQTKQGFYFLPGRSETVLKRANSVLPTEFKLRRARLAAKLISWVPFLRAIFVCNSVAAETANGKSDIDLFIVTEIGRIWFVRFFTNIILRAFGLRTGRESADRICLSFYADIAHLNFESLRVKPDDIYLSFWVLQLLPIYDPENISAQIFEKNSWVKEYTPNTAGTRGKKNINAHASPGKLGNWLEKVFRGIQWKVLPSYIKTESETGGVGVVLKDGVLKFHVVDARLSIRDRWLAKQNIYVK